MSEICVVGSINMDIVTSVDEYPKRGQTVFGNKVSNSAGGKGANQAISCSRQGKKVSLIGCVGNDYYGEKLIDNLKRNRVDTSTIKRDGVESTGQTTILLDNQAENTIIYVEGANKALNEKYVLETLSTLTDCKILLIQMEIPSNTVLEVMKYAKQRQIFVVLDPAPANDVTDEMLTYADIILPNAHETELLTGITIIDEKTARQAATIFLEKGVSQGVLKLGKDGSYVFNENKITFIEGIKVGAVDTVGAGDCFAGALASALIDRQQLLAAVEFANIAAALKVTKHGAQEGIPTIEEIKSFCHENDLTTYLNFQPS
jgi:ribokinase